MPTPFTLHVADDVLADLRARLERARLPDEPPLEPWSTGTSVAYLTGIRGGYEDAVVWLAA